MVTEIEARLGQLEGSYSSLRQRLQVLVQLAERRGCIDKSLASRIRRQQGRKSTTKDAKVCLQMLRARLARLDAPSKTFELRDEDFPKLPERRVTETRGAMPVLQLPGPHTCASATPQNSTISPRDLWFRDNTGMMHFGAAPPPDVSIVATGRIMNGTLVM